MAWLTAHLECDFALLCHQTLKVRYPYLRGTCIINLPNASCQPSLKETLNMLWKAHLWMQQKVAPGVSNAYQQVWHTIPACHQVCQSVLCLSDHPSQWTFCRCLTGKAHLAVMRQTLLKAVFVVGMLAFAKTIPSSREDIMMPVKCSTVHTTYASRVSGFCNPAEDTPLRSS